MEVARILENKPQGIIYGLMGNVSLSTNTENHYIVTDYKFKGPVKEYLNSDKDLSSLKMVMLNEEDLNKTSLDLSNMDLKKVSLAKSLIEKKDYIILDYFEKGLNNRKKENFKRLFKKLTRDIHKTILIYTNDIEFLWDIASLIIYTNNNKIIRTYKKEEYFELIEKINKPEICKFINLMREKNIQVENYKDAKDLLKAIYRIKESK